MAESVVSLTYGTALYEAAKELGKTEKMMEEIIQLSKVIQQNLDLKEFLDSPAIAIEEKKEIVEKIFRNRVSDEIVNFLFVLIDKGRTREITRIRKDFVKLYDKEKGIAEGKIYSAIELSEEQREQFEKEMSQLLRKKVKLRNIIDKSLIGGVKIQADGKLIDKSLKAELIRLSIDLKK